MHIQDKKRDALLKEALDRDIVLLLERFNLQSTKSSTWISVEDNTHIHMIFTQKFLLKCDQLTALFRIKKLCWAKVNYFKRNIEKFITLKHDPFMGFKQCELWDSDFLQHKRSGTIIDYNFLVRIRDIEKFKLFCIKLDEFE